MCIHTCTNATMCPLIHSHKCICMETHMYACCIHNNRVYQDLVLVLNASPFSKLISLPPLYQNMHTHRHPSSRPFHCPGEFERLAPSLNELIAWPVGLTPICGSTFSGLTAKLLSYDSCLGPEPGINSEGSHYVQLNHKIFHGAWCSIVDINSWEKARMICS